MDLVSRIKKIPPVTRYLCLAAVGATGAAHLGILDPYWVFYDTDYVLRKHEVWRIYSSFLVGKFRLSFIFDMMTLYKTMKHLETQFYERRSSDLAYQLMWVAPTILAATHFQNPFPQRALLFSIVYLYSRLFPNKMTSIMGLVQVSMKYKPFIMIAFDLLTEGSREAGVGIAGCAVGHIWWKTVWGDDSAGQGVLSRQAMAPDWLREWMGEYWLFPPTSS